MTQTKLTQVLTETINQNGIYINNKLKLKYNHENPNKLADILHEENIITEKELEHMKNYKHNGDILKWIQNNKENINVSFEYSSDLSMYENHDM